MGIILNNLKSKDNKEYRYLDYNDLAIGQIGMLLIDFLEKNNKNKNILNVLGINKYELYEDNILFKKCLINIETDSILYNGKEYYPKEELKFLYEISDKLKNFYSKDGDKHIYPDKLIKEIFKLQELSEKKIEDMFDFENFMENNLDVEDDAKIFLNIIEEELIYTTINSESPKYDVESIVLNKKEVNLNISDLKDMTPILYNGNTILWNKKESIGMTGSMLDIQNINLDETIKYLSNPSYELDKMKSIKKYSYQYLNDLILIDENLIDIENDLKEIESLDDSIIKLKLYLMKSILEVDSYGEYLRNDNNLKTYKKNLIVELNKINRLNSINNPEEKLIKVFNNINTILKSFRKEETSINVKINNKNKGKSFIFESNFHQIKAVLDSYSNKTGLSLLLPGPPDFGKSHSVDEMVELFGGTVIKQEHIISLSALVGTFEKRPANFDPSKRTHPLTELKTSIINGEYGGGVIHMEEGARTFMELLGSKVNSPDESALLSILEPMSRPNKYWKTEAYGNKIKLFPAEHVKFIWSTNFIPKNLSPEIQVRFRSIPMDFSTITNYTTLKKISNNMLFETNVEKELKNFSNENNPKLLLETIKDIYKHTSLEIKSLDCSKIDSIYKNSKDEKEFSENIKSEKQDKITTFMTENRISPYELLKTRENLEVILMELKFLSGEFSSKDNDFIIGESFNKLRIKNAIEVLNKNFDLDVDYKKAINEFGNNVNAISKSFEERGIRINDSIQRFYSIDMYLMTAINQFKYLKELKNSLLISKSMISSSSKLLPISSKYISNYMPKMKSINEKYEVIMDNYLKIASNYNSKVSSKYNELVNSYNGEYSITPFKSKDAPIIGFEKISKSLNGLFKSMGYIDKDLLKIMTIGSNSSEIKEMISDYENFIIIEENDQDFGGVN